MKTLKDLTKKCYLEYKENEEEINSIENIVNVHDLRQSAIEWIKVKLKENHLKLYWENGEIRVIVEPKAILPLQKAVLSEGNETKDFMQMTMDLGAIKEKIRFFNINEDDLK